MLGPVLIAVALAVAATPLPPRTERFVYDTAGVIDEAAERALEQRHQALFERTGVAIAVITVPRLVDETIDELAVRAGQTWGVGRKAEDRGLVIALSRADREIFVATGYGTEGYLPDGRVGALIDEHALPALRQDQFSAGIVGLATALAAEAARAYDVTLPDGPAVAPSPAAPPAPGGWIRTVLVLLGLLGFGLLAWRHPLLALMLFSGMGRGRGGGGFGGGFGGGGFGGGGFGGGGAGRGF